MGERLEEVNLAKVGTENSEDLQVLKRICLRYAHQFEILPCIVYELDSISEERIPEVFMDKRIILSEDINGGSLILVNPEIFKKFGKKYVKYSDISDKATWMKDKKIQIALSDITETKQFLEKMAELDDTTRIKQITKSGKNAFRQSLKVGEKVGKGAKTVGQKAVIPAAKKIGSRAVKAGKGFVNFMDIIG